MLFVTCLIYVFMSGNKVLIFVLHPDKGWGVQIMMSKFPA